MSPTTCALSALKVAVACRRRPLPRRQLVRVHPQTHRAPRLSPLCACGIEYLTEALLLGLQAGLVNFIPYLGSFSGFILATGVALVQFWGDWWMVALVAFVFIFGQVAEGQDVADKLTRTMTGNNTPIPGAEAEVINTVEIQVK